MRVLIATDAWRPQVNGVVRTLTSLARAAARPEAIHIATEGPVGWWTRSYCLRHKLPFTTSYTTRFPEYVSVRTGIPESWGYAVVRRFHNSGRTTMVATNS